MDNILEINNVSIGFPNRGQGESAVYNNVKANACKYELVALFGPNGIGKSTLLRTIVKLLNPLSGDIRLFNRDIKTFSGSEMARRVSFVSTEAIYVNNLRVRDLVSFGRYPHTNWAGRLQKKDKEIIEESISLVGIESLSDKYIDQLSDGERQKAMIARTLAQDTEIIVLDEPTAYLDLPNRYEIIHLLRNLASNKKKTVIFSTHDLAIAIQEADKVWLMLPELICQGAPEDLIIQGVFNRMFNHTNLEFNTVKGEFRIRKDLKKAIGLHGENREYLWTKNALERIGFLVTNNQSENFNVRIDKSDAVISWIFSLDGSSLQFSSIYQLCRYLSNLHNRSLLPPL